ncbi:hypothetical protein GGI43DRAFT_430802 [Trichoderma evansii]
MFSSTSASDTSATLDKFYYFGHLPCELRIMIWKLAARSVRRGVHVLGATRSGQAGTGPGNGSATSLRGTVGLTLVAPKARDISGSARNWVDGNPSTYIQDFGLWRACYESHAIMRRHYERLEEAITKEGARQLAEEEDEAHQTSSTTDWDNNASSTQSRFVHLREEWLFKAFPTEDLLCLQPLETSLPFSISPFFELPNSLRNGSLNKFKNIALEYDPTWMTGSVHARPEAAKARARNEMWREDSLRGVFIRALWAIVEHQGPANLTFWLIDRTVRRRENPLNVYMPFADDSDDEMETQEKAEPRVFHGNDGRYVEVGDLRECKYNVVKSNTAFHFLHWLQIEVGFNVRWITGQHPGRNNLPTPNGLGDLVKILCVEPT